MKDSRNDSHVELEGESNKPTILDGIMKFVILSTQKIKLRDGKKYLTKW